ncbi:hypothetical protein EHJ10_20030 [Cronobacter dublinensis]|nr:hypothetical protein [Cronobacter dublinensis]NCH73025.1 hypothetical protein [Cronobacter dublinensis]
MYGVNAGSCAVNVRFATLWLQQARKTATLTVFCAKKRRLKSFLRLGVVRREELPIMRLH